MKFIVRSIGNVWQKISVMCEGVLSMDASEQHPFFEQWRCSIYVMEAQTCFIHLSWSQSLASVAKCRFVQLAMMFFSAEEAITMLMRAMNG
mmetsp:Transcript_25791/g.42575  ORF Transcript_25791/g.42575 Transcript_25791/m.42575 type:complete len:91 (-) Transcript_25791:644-916(-)